ncbi:MAG: FAD-dependent monooxygenase [Paraburkholderia sp.]|uniref:FAD-dependent monooxygenase n=1 Tax=Paraburkholderia sp. TaxID=1926495 RepID=UPI003C3604EB
MSKSNDACGSSRIKVLIVGGGPVGMAMSVLLNRFEIEHVLVERGEGVTDHPKARGCSTRTMELFRQWGIEEQVRSRGLPDGTDVFAMVESISGHEYGRTIPELNIGQSPSWKSIVSQDVVEEELLKVVQTSEYGRLHYHTEFLHFSKSEGGINVTTRDLKSGAEREWFVEFLIAADGAASSVRRQTGIEMRGPSTLAVMSNDYWMADLSGIPRIATTAGYRVAPHTPDGEVGAVLNTNGKDRWLSVSRVGTEKDERATPRTDDEVIQLARIQAGIPNLEVKVINRSVWRLSRQVAARFSDERIFLIGDAAHRFPPNGAFGMNSGIQDAHNLAWKLKLVFDGKAGRGLLDSYDLERRPVAESNADFSLGNRSRLEKTDIAMRTRNPDELEFWIRDTNNHVHSSGQDLGFSYREGAVVPDGTVPIPLQSRYYVPSDRPGGRFPHVWTNLARTESTLDWFDKAFVLVAGPKADAWLDAARNVSEKTGVTIETRQLDVANEADGLLMGLRGAVLVRPDGHVAWRMPWVPSDPAAELASVVDKVLFR